MIRALASSRTATDARPLSAALLLLLLLALAAPPARARDDAGSINPHRTANSGQTTGEQQTHSPRQTTGLRQTLALRGDEFLTPASDSQNAPALRENYQAQLEAPRRSLGLGQQLLIASTYLTLYGFATDVGSRRRVDKKFKIVRLEKAYVYDFVGHAFLVREVGGMVAAVHRFAGVDPAQARTEGVWYAEFGSEMYMEILNGWVHDVRFDPLDPVANFTGAMMATKGRDLAAAHPWIDRFSLQFGYKDWGRAFRPSKQDNATLASIWHDHANGRFGLGYDIGPAKRPWVCVFLSYEITSLQIEDLKNRFGMGIELQPVNWLKPAIRKLPGGPTFLKVHDWLNERILFPGLYIQLFHVDAPAFSSQEPFHE